MSLHVLRCRSTIKPLRKVFLCKLFMVMSLVGTSRRTCIQCVPKECYSLKAPVSKVQICVLQVSNEPQECTFLWYSGIFKPTLQMN